MVTTRFALQKHKVHFQPTPNYGGAPTDHIISIREIRLAAGAEFVVMLCGGIMTMPGLAKAPSAEKIDYIDGKIIGLL